MSPDASLCRRWGFREETRFGWLAQELCVCVCVYHVQVWYADVEALVHVGVPDNTHVCDVDGTKVALHVCDNIIMSHMISHMTQCSPDHYIDSIHQITVERKVVV